MDKAPELYGSLRKNIIKMPAVMQQASGIRVFGKLIRSLVFTTDIAIMRNCNADAVIAVYPFTPQPVITQALTMAADIPIFCGVGGGITMGKRVVNLALDAEFKGAIGVVVNAPTSNETIASLRETIDIPVVVTVVTEETDFMSRVAAGANIFNVSGAQDTIAIVRRIRDIFPEIPIIATGGPSDETIADTIAAGANAITITPPTTAELFKIIMDRYREECVDGPNA